MSEKKPERQSNYYLHFRQKLLLFLSVFLSPRLSAPSRGAPPRPEIKVATRVQCVKRRVALSGCQTAKPQFAGWRRRLTPKRETGQCAGHRFPKMVCFSLIKQRWMCWTERKPNQIFPLSVLSLCLYQRFIIRLWPTAVQGIKPSG